MIRLNRVGRLPTAFLACLLAGFALSALFPAPACAYQRPKDSRPKKKATPAPTKPKASAADAEEEPAAESRRKLDDLRADEPLPHLQDLPVPAIEQLHERPVDWILLKGANPQVVIVKPVFPRPDTLRKLETALDDLRKRPRPTSAEEREKFAAQRNDLQNLIVTLPGDADGNLFEIPTRVIDHIIYHEDLIVRRARILIEEKRFRDAFELLYALERISPAWSGLKEQTQRLLFLEAEDAAKRGDLESALTSLEELHARTRDYPQLEDRLGEVADKLIRQSRKADDFREARHFLDRLARIEPKHEVVGTWSAAFLAEAKRLMELALEARRGGRHGEAAAAIDRAARVWPAMPGLRDAHRELNDRYQRLPVGVLNLPGEAAHLSFAALADRREARLTQFDLFEVDRIDDATHYRSSIIEQWEPTDLGRRALFALTSTRSRWESRPILTATAVLAAIEARLDPGGPAYDERFSSYVESVRVRSPFELEIRFSHAPPRTEPLFRFPVTEVRREPGVSEGVGRDARRVLSRRFEKIRATETEAVYRRAVPQPDGARDYYLAEVIERRYDSPEHAMQGLLRGDVSLLPDLPSWAVAPLRPDQRFFVLDYAIPTTHVLQFHPRSRPLKSRELRLAMAYAIDAPRILSGTVLRDPHSASPNSPAPNSPGGRLTTAPFATTGYAYDSLVPHRTFNAGIAASLYDAAAKRLKTVPTLRMVCEPGVSAQAAAAEIVKQWKRVGIPVELQAGNGSGPDPSSEWDVAYRTLRMEEPLVELWPFLTVDSGARLESLRYLPDWLRLELLELDNAGDWKSAVARLQQLQAHLYAEVAYIPLWEVDDSLVLRKNVHDFPPLKFVSTYQDVERWVVQPWFPEDVP